MLCLGCTWDAHAEYVPRTLNLQPHHTHPRLPLCLCGQEMAEEDEPEEDEDDEECYDEEVRECREDI